MESNWVFFISLFFFLLLYHTKKLFLHIYRYSTYNNQRSYQMTDNKEEPKVVQTRRKVSSTHNERLTGDQPNTVEEEIIVVESNDNLDDSLRVNAISEQEAIREGEKAGIKPEVTKAVLGNRKIIIAFIALIGVLVIFALGVVTGLKGASIIAEEVGDANSEISYVGNGDEEDSNKILPPEDAQIDKGWTEGYKDGFYEGFYNGINSSQNQYMDYGTTE
jgi:hypothetical protein